MNNKSALSDIVSWLFGGIVVAIGLINTFWGNDPGFGIFLLALSLAYFPVGNTLFTKITRRPIPWWLKILLGLFILWAALGVGELFDKVDLMLTHF